MKCVQLCIACAVVAFLWLHPAEAARAQTSAAVIATDRPGNGNAATVVPEQRFNVETGVNYGYDHTAGISAHTLSFPTALRVGIVTPVELRLGYNIAVFQNIAGDSSWHASDTRIGTKVALWHSTDFLSAVAFVLDVYLPTGNSILASEEVVAESRVAARWSLPAGLGLLINLGADYNNNAAGGVRLLHVVNLGYVLPVWDGRLNVFVETFGLTRFDESFPDLVQFDAGLLLRLSNTLQFDVFTQHALHEELTDFQIALGVSVLI